MKTARCPSRRTGEPARKANQKPMSLLEKELLEQGTALGRRSRADRSAIAAAAALIAQPDVDFLVLAARGSSDNAARFAQYAFGSDLRLPVALAAPSLFREQRRSPDLRGAAVLGISQSGQSPDIVRVLAEGCAQHRPTIALTNDPESPLASVADIVIPLKTGPEKSVAATKTYLSSLYVMEQIIDQIRPNGDRRRWLERLPEIVDERIRKEFSERARFDLLKNVNVLTVIGRGLDYSAAFETALKVRELAGIATEAFSPADLLHGPVAGISDSGGLWIIDTPNARDETLTDLLGAIRGLDLPTVVVSHRIDQPAPGYLPIELPPHLPGWVRSILAVLSGQVAAFHLATRRNVDLDHPHGLAKVTLTT